MREMSSSELRRARMADAVSVAGCVDPGCECNQVTIVLRDERGTPFALANLPAKDAPEFAAKILQAAEMANARAVARAHGCQGRA